MSWCRSETKSEQGWIASAKNRRREPRIGGQFKVRYSGSIDHDIVMGHGTIVDLSRYGFGIRGDRGLQPGTELALFVELPELESPICIPQAVIAWVNGRRFGVELRVARENNAGWLDQLHGEFEPR